MTFIKFWGYLGLLLAHIPLMSFVVGFLFSLINQPSTMAVAVGAFGLIGVVLYLFWFAVFIGRRVKQFTWENLFDA